MLLEANFYKKTNGTVFEPLHFVFVQTLGFKVFLTCPTSVIDSLHGAPNSFPLQFRQVCNMGHSRGEIVVSWLL